MFYRIFLFEIEYRLRRPGFYVYFTAFLLLSIFFFGIMPPHLEPNQHLNGPAHLTLFFAFASMIMMLVSSSFMGSALYRDLEFNTKEYYLSYPITKAGYFWGRYLGSLVIIAVINSATFLGAFLGIHIGTATGMLDASHVGHDQLMFYLHPFLVIALPNLLFHASIFFGLVAVTKNVKVIYSSGIVLFLGYLVANIYLSRGYSANIVDLADPFAINGVRNVTNFLTVDQKNTLLVEPHGNFLVNRLLWPGIGILILLLTYFRFSFEKFFTSASGKRLTVPRLPTHEPGVAAPTISFTGDYAFRTIRTLVRIELLSVIRDFYFWVILLVSSAFFTMLFADLPRNYDVEELPRTVLLLFFFGHQSQVNYFFILVFYAGEMIHREKSTGYSTIHDTLPPSNAILFSSKIISLWGLSLMLIMLPMLLGISVQLLKGFHQLELPVYLKTIAGNIAPKVTMMVLLAAFIHVIVPNKFAGHGIGIVIWVALFGLFITGKVDYFLVLYSYAPAVESSDLYGIPGLQGAVAWFETYWLLCGLTLVSAAYFFFIRGTFSSAKERMKLAAERFTGAPRNVFLICATAFGGVGCFVYYNVSYRNNYLTHDEQNERSALFETTLKKYESLPLPKVISLKMNVDLYPSTQTASTRAEVKLVNETRQTIHDILIDGDNVTRYTLSSNGAEIAYTEPLKLRTGKLNWFRSRFEPSAYRLYHLPAPLNPGDSITISVASEILQRGFTNNFLQREIFTNGTFFFGGLPHMGYDAMEELSSPEDRRKYGLPQKPATVHALPEADDAQNLLNSPVSNLVSLDLTISTEIDQTAIAPGALERQWVESGRRYFHYIQSCAYMPLAIMSGMYSTIRDTVLVGKQSIATTIVFSPKNAVNVVRYQKAYRDGLTYMTEHYGEYSLPEISLVETPVVGPNTASFAGVNTIREIFGWNADLRNHDQLDYCYLEGAQQVARQWWGLQVAPNETPGSAIISEGLSRLAAITIMSKHEGEGFIKRILQNEAGGYEWGRFIDRIRNGNSVRDYPLCYAAKPYEYHQKATIVLAGLQDLLGEYTLNRALREFRDEFAFRSRPPFAGTADLYRCLKKYTPDSLTYFLKDNWENVSFYDNKIVNVSVEDLKRNNEFSVHITVATHKSYTDSIGAPIAAPLMADYIDLAIFGADTRTASGSIQKNPLWFRKCKFADGEHTFDIVVKGRPVQAGIDPYYKLVDKSIWDNNKDL